MTPPRWVRIGTLADIPRLGSRIVKTKDGPVAVFRAAEDRVFALANQCPHKGGPLSEGIVSGQAVVCPLHNWTIDLESGQALPPDQGCARTVEVRTDGPDLWLKVAAPDRAPELESLPPGANAPSSIRK